MLSEERLGLKKTRKNNRLIILSLKVFIVLKKEEKCVFCLSIRKH